MGHRILGTRNRIPDLNPCRIHGLINTFQSALRSIPSASRLLRIDKLLKFRIFRGQDKRIGRSKRDFVDRKIPEVDEPHTYLDETASTVPLKLLNQIIIE